MKKILLVFMFLISACSVKQPPMPTVELTPEAIEQAKTISGYWIEVQIPQRKLLIAKGSHLIKAFPVAVGAPGYPTPVGNKTINQVIWNPWWKPPKTSDWVTDATPVPPRTPENPLGEIKMPLGSAYLIHGTKAVSSIGTWASHGCIRMLFEDLFGLVQLLLTEYSHVNAIDEMEKANKDTSKEFSTPLSHDVPVILTYETVRIKNGYITISPDLYNRLPDQAEYVAEKITPFLKKDQEVNPRKIKSVLKLFNGRTIHMPIENLI